MPELRAMLHLLPSQTANDAIAALRSAPLDAEVTALVRADDCFVGAASPYVAAVETVVADDDLQTALDRLAEIADRLAGTIDRDRSMALVGSDIAFVPPTPTSRRFQYLMRRRNDFSHEAYLRRYREIHSRFGIETPHIEGYVQHHVDLELSARLGAATGLHDDPCDSVSELYIAGVPHFIEGILAHPDLAAAAEADEREFVDRERSFGFVHRVLGGRTDLQE